MKRAMAAAAACGILLFGGVAAATNELVVQRAEQQRPQQNERAQKNDRAEQNARAQQNDRAKQNERAQQNARAQQNDRAKQNERAQQNERAKQNERAQPNERAQNGNRPSTPGRGRVTAADVQARMRELPESVRRFGDSNRQNDRMTVNAVARGVARGMAPAALSLRAAGDRVQVRNNKGDVLFDLAETRARDLGAWQLRMLGDRRPAGNAPAFCRTGAGHPVWGREWCIDKGFGLGHSNPDMLWSRGSVGDIIFGRRIEADRLDRPDLLSTLGDIVFGRLALHALTLGFTEPLMGVYVAEPNAPHVLRVQSNGMDVAELVDVNGDNRVDVLYVTQYR